VNGQTIFVEAMIHFRICVVVIRIHPGGGLPQKPPKKRGRREDGRDGVEREIIGQEVWLTAFSADTRQFLSLPREDWQKDQQQQSSPDLLDV
jgi:hypothetical protein